MLAARASNSAGGGGIGSKQLEAITVGVGDAGIGALAAGGGSAVRDVRGGVVVWSGPRSGKALFQGGVAIRLALGLVASVGFAKMRRVMALVEAVGAAAEAAVQGGVCYQVWVVGVGEGRVGEGTATRLFGGVLERCDAVGVPCCCVVFGGAGAGFLESVGFREKGKARMPSGAPSARVWVRESREPHGVC